MTETQSLHSYVVVFRATSSVRFEEDGYLRLTSVKTPSGLLELTFRTRYDDEKFDAKIPRELWIDARGTAPSFDQAINGFAGTVAQYLPVFSVSENAAIFDLRVHLAYCSTPGVTEREFFQSFLPDERGMPRITRKFNSRVAGLFTECIAKLSSEDRDRLLRACGQYQQALTYWDPGHELLALAHLYMGVEAITDVVIRQQCAKLGVGEDGLVGGHY